MLHVKRKLDLCHASTGAWSEFVFEMTTPKLRSRSFTRKTRKPYRVEVLVGCLVKQRQVDLLTKSSLRLLVDRTVVYIQQESGISGKA